MTVPEARLDRNDAGLAPAGEGWFVLNAKDARWFHAGTGGRLTFFEGEAERWKVGVNVCVLEPGQPMAMYHWENEQENFLVIAGEPVLVVEGEERPLRSWDLVHCPPGTRHVIVGAGAGPAVIVGLGSRGSDKDDWGAFAVDETAAKLGASVDEETSDQNAAYARFPAWRAISYPGQLLP